MNENNKTYFVIQTLFLIIFLFGSFVLVIYTLRAFVWPIFFAFLLYVIFDKYNKKLINYLKYKDLSTLLSILLILLFVVGPISLLIYLLIEEMIFLFTLIKSSIESGDIIKVALNFDSLISLLTEDPFFWLTFLNRLGYLIKEYPDYFSIFNLSGIVGGAYNVFLISLSFTLKIIIYILLGFVILYFLLRDGHSFYVSFSKMLPFDQSLMDEFKNELKLVTSAILKGNILISILQGIFLAFGFLLAGIPNVILYGFLAAIFSIVPVLGTSIVWLPASLYLYFVKHSIGWAIFLAIYCLTSFLVLENVVKPKFLNKQIGIPSILLFLAIIGGLKEFGITGIILGPLSLALFIIIWRLYPLIKNENRVDTSQKNLL
jgi:predicted PurR-regulated permease PerM